MATAKKTASGRWRVQVYYDGKTHSITRDTKREAEYAALEMQMQHKREVGRVTVGKAIDAYIASKDGVLSPTTIEGYEKIRRNYLQSLMDVPLSSLNELVVQSAFNAESKRITRQGTTPTPKTMANVRGLFSAAMAQYGLHFSPTIPAKRKRVRTLPEPQEIYSIIRGTDIELPCMLAMWLSFTMSEVRGIRVCDIKDGIMAINQVVVDVRGMPLAKAAGKEYDRNRALAVPPYIMRLIEDTPAWKDGDGYIITASGESIRGRFRRLCAKADVDITFHDLRHVNASVMLQLNVPDKYAMERGGWKTDTTMKRVYQETFSRERKNVDALIDSYFDDVTKNFAPKK